MKPYGTTGSIHLDLDMSILLEMILYYHYSNLYHYLFFSHHRCFFLFFFFFFFLIYIYIHYHYHQHNYFYYWYIYIYMGVSINGGTHKWMIYKGKSQSKMDDMGGSPISGPPQYIRFSLTNHWFWGTPNLGYIYIYICDDICCSPRWFFFLEARQFQGVGDGQFGAAGLGDHGQWGSMVFFFFSNVWTRFHHETWST